MSNVRMMEPRDLANVQRLQAMCNPTWPNRPALWWHAHPTLVMDDFGLIVGSTSFSISIATDSSFQNRGAEVAYGHGVNVHPERQGHWHGWALAQARHAALKELGITFFMGFTQPGNKPMLSIFRKQGLTFHTRLPRIYPDGSDGLMYVGGVR